ncbi:MAG: pyridoxine 5'-phosphate synthase [Nitrospirae bacterium CG_4_10_14_3_um_filter_53_41]|nr:MAG: pyridoxine 5'-phosphate synthase [Nitrospirae bacterium CG2_30_53_67]PIW84193.1 MAG: pyridoxine 5'-phosphate synthase [Nitrospirae bacterium CG_4_8_14_3_um_filter_50_41]PIX86485.1 MAG: pyridoxine 5'-phosphate synthase [Nitrospirae bacterium CG_4_10_14_3_um_filter_53_41]
MTRLGVNIDHVATIRQARLTTEPDPVAAALIAELAGADGITIHLREDRRHIQDRDLSLIRRVIHVRLNLEMAATEEIIRIALKERPDAVCLVPEKRAELTTEGGLDVAAHGKSLKQGIRRLRHKGIEVSIFVDPDPRQVIASKELNADAVEIHTGAYAEAKGKAQARELERIHRAVQTAREIGISIHAGHGLTYRNVSRIAAIPEIEELNIGHSIISRAVLVGLERAVREMKALVNP